jgi:SAM-dependent methyltransferase
MESIAYQEMFELEDRRCGTGGNLELLSKYGTVYAAECDAGSRKIAESKGIARSVEHCVLPEQFPFDDKKFDLIVMLDVLEHIHDDQASLSVVHSRLTETGWFLVTVPAFQFLWSSHDVFSHHFRRYTRALLRERLRRAGLTIRYESFFNAALLPAVAAVRLIKNKVVGNQVASSDNAMPPSLINTFLTWILGSERHAMGRVRLPFGVSLIVAATRDGTLLANWDRIGKPLGRG